MTRVSRIIRRATCRSALEPPQPKRHPQVERIARVTPARAEELPDPIQPLTDRVRMDVQAAGGVGGFRSRREPGLERLHKLGSTLFVVVEDRPDPAPDERLQFLGATPAQHETGQTDPTASLTSPSRPRVSNVDRHWRAST